jgi:hypothetical protein
MEASPAKRRLVAILAANVAGYSRMVAENEEATLRTLGVYRATIGDMTSASMAGGSSARPVTAFLAEFTSAVQAVRAAVAIQRALPRRNADLSQRRRMEFRIGVNLGDVVAEGDDLLGMASTSPPVCRRSPLPPASASLARCGTRSRASSISRCPPWASGGEPFKRAARCNSTNAVARNRGAIRVQKFRADDEAVTPEPGGARRRCDLSHATAPRPASPARAMGV